MSREEITRHLVAIGDMPSVLANSNPVDKECSTGTLASRSPMREAVLCQRNAVLGYAQPS
jgi:hypothetical protein